MEEVDIKNRFTDLETSVSSLEDKVSELEKENALMMRALAKLAEGKAEELGIEIPDKPETSTN